MRKILLGLYAIGFIGFAGCTPNPRTDESGFAGASPTAASTADIIVEPEDGVRPVVDIVNSAKESIKLSIYTFIGDDGGVTKAVEAIAKAKKRGISVTILMNRFAKDGWPKTGYSTLNLEHDWCEAEKIRCIPSSSVFTYNHNKYFVIDNKTVYLMTGNLTPEDFGHARNFIIKIDNNHIVTFFNKLFKADINNAKENTGYSPSGIPQSVVLSPVNSAKKIEKFIRDTKKHLDIYAMYFGEDMPSSILTALRSVAAREVQVRIISNRTFDHKLLSELAKKHPAIQLILLDDKVQKLFIHTKVFIRDKNSVLLGSVNMSDTSLNKNREVSYISESPIIVETILKRFNEDWMRFDT